MTSGLSSLSASFPAPSAGTYAQPPPSAACSSPVPANPTPAVPYPNLPPGIAARPPAPTPLPPSKSPSVHHPPHHHIHHSILPHAHPLHPAQHHLSLPSPQSFIVPPALPSTAFSSPNLVRNPPPPRSVPIASHNASRSNSGGKRNRAPSATSEPDRPPSKVAKSMAGSSINNYHQNPSSGPRARNPSHGSIHFAPEDHTSVLPNMAATSDPNEEDPEDTGEIRCICSVDDDDGYTIQCDRCLVWQHAVCVGIHRDNEPEHYFCDQCHPRDLDIRRAIALQRRRIKNLGTAKSSDPDPDATSLSVIGSPNVSGNNKRKGSTAQSSSKSKSRSVTDADKKKAKRPKINVLDRPALGSGTPLVSSKRTHHMENGMSLLGSPTATLPPLPPNMARHKPPMESMSVLVSQYKSARALQTEQGEDTEVDEGMSQGDPDDLDLYSSPVTSAVVSPTKLSDEALTMRASTTLQGQRVNLDSLVVPAYSLISPDYSMNLVTHHIDTHHEDQVRRLIMNAQPGSSLSIVNNRFSDPFLSQHPKVSLRIMSATYPTTCLLVTSALDSLADSLPIPYAVPQAFLNRSHHSCMSSSSSNRPNLAATTFSGVSFASLHPDIGSYANRNGNSMTDLPAPISLVSPATSVPAGTPVVPYLGKLVPLEQGAGPPLRPYTLHVPGVPLLVDASNNSNIARFVRRACKGNLTPHTYVRRNLVNSMTDSISLPDQLVVALVSNQDIRPGEPLAVTWSKDELHMLANELQPPSVSDSNADQYLLFECTSCPLVNYTNCSLYKTLLNNPRVTVVPVTMQGIVDPTPIVAASVAAAAVSGTASKQYSKPGSPSHRDGGHFGARGGRCNGAMHGFNPCQGRQPCGNLSKSGFGSPSYSSLGFTCSSASLNSSAGLDAGAPSSGMWNAMDMEHYDGLASELSTVDKLKIHENHILAAIALIHHRVRARGLVVAHRGGANHGLEDGYQRDLYSLDDNGGRMQEPTHSNGDMPPIDILADDSDDDVPTFRVQVRAIRVVKQKNVPATYRVRHPDSGSSDIPKVRCRALAVGKRNWKRQFTAKKKSLVPASAVCSDPGKDGSGVTEMDTDSRCSWHVLTPQADNARSLQNGSMIPVSKLATTNESPPMATTKLKPLPSPLNRSPLKIPGRAVVSATDNIPLSAPSSQCQYKLKGVSSNSSPGIHLPGQSRTTPPLINSDEPIADRGRPESQVVQNSARLSSGVMGPVKTGQSLTKVDSVSADKSLNEESRIITLSDETKDQTSQSPPDLPKNQSRLSLPPLPKKPVASQLLEKPIGLPVSSEVHIDDSDPRIPNGQRAMSLHLPTEPQFNPVQTRPASSPSLKSQSADGTAPALVTLPPHRVPSVVSLPLPPSPAAAGIAPSRHLGSKRFSLKDYQKKLTQRTSSAKGGATPVLSELHTSYASVIKLPVPLLPPPSAASSSSSMPFSIPLPARKVPVSQKSHIGDEKVP